MMFQTCALHSFLPCCQHFSLNAYLYDMHSMVSGVCWCCSTIEFLLVPLPMWACPRKKVGNHLCLGYCTYLRTHQNHSAEVLTIAPLLPNWQTWWCNLAAADRRGRDIASIRGCDVVQLEFHTGNIYGTPP